METSLCDYFHTYILVTGNIGVVGANDNTEVGFKNCTPFRKLLDFSYFEKNNRLIAADLSKQKALDADSRAIQQIIFTDKANAAAMISYILEQSKETTLQFFKGATKV